MKREYVVILVTAGSEREAKKIAKWLLKKECVACINIIPRVGSYFLWKGKMEQAVEALLLIKTERSCLNRVTKLVKELHSYEVPEVIALPIIGGNEDYLSWIRENVGGKAKRSCKKEKECYK